MTRKARRGGIHWRVLAPIPPKLLGILGLGFLQGFYKCDTVDDMNPALA